MAVLDSVARSYEPTTAAARQRYVSTPAYLAVVDPDATPAFLDRFLIEFCSLGVQMTQPVEGWIRRAGQRCCELGLVELGLALDRHADHEADHHLLMIDDAKRLVELWNQEGRGCLDADELCARPPTAGIEAYVELHERAIESPQPWTQLAIEFEIERLSVTAGPELMGNVARRCGPERIASLRFLTEHIKADQGHTEFNRRQLVDLLDAHPDWAGPLGAAGSAALDAHAGFIDDCVEGARSA